MYFDPMPLPTVAFILTTIQFCLEEWETGTFKAKELRADHQYNTYCVHLRGLQQYDTVANARLMRFRQRWFQFAIQHSGASVVVPAQTQEVTNAADVRPDTPVNTRSRRLSCKVATFVSATLLLFLCRAAHHFLVSPVPTIILVAG
ncbi:hypothetical protein FRC11_014824 [Ceratobasidium sp. 423]|nr:hypothetical protein FRC11_014824 [Ceratobasidium sp. 423]